jgi:hypothetical protein
MGHLRYGNFWVDTSHCRVIRDFQRSQL